METLEQAQQTIYREITTDDAEVRAEFVKHFESKARVFSESMSEAFLAWRSLDAMLQEDEKRGPVSQFVYAAVTLHVLSLKLLLSGQTVAAGNLLRQVVETIALALLCSGKDLDILPRFMKDHYSTQKAVRDVLRHWQALGLKQDGVQALQDAEKFYHHYSHITRLTLGTMLSFSESALYVGASFDDGKIDAYRQEVEGRVSLAKVFPNFVAAVVANLKKW